MPYDIALICTVSRKQEGAWTRHNNYEPLNDLFLSASLHFAFRIPMKIKLFF